LSYIKTIWTDKVTPLSATNFNKIEQGIFDLDGNKISTSQKGVANGVATLDSGILIPVAQLPVIPTAKLTNSLASLDAITQQHELLGQVSIVNDTTLDITFSNLPSGYSKFRLIGEAATTQARSADNAWDITMKLNGIASGYTSVTKHSLIAPTFDATGAKISFGRFLVGHYSDYSKSSIDIMVDAIPSSAFAAKFLVYGTSKAYNSYGSGFDETAAQLDNDATRITSIVISNQYWDYGTHFNLYGIKA